MVFRCPDRTAIMHCVPRVTRLPGRPRNRLGRLRRVTEPTTPRRGTAIDAIAEEYLDASAALDPVSATFAGLPGHDDRMTDYSPGGHAARTELARRTLAALTGPGAPVATDDVD